MGRNEIELLVRGVWLRGANVLLCRNRRKGNIYLPGGHLEWGESALDSLAREWQEELGLKCRVGRFLGAVEHTFDDGEERVCEINLVFRVHVPGAPSQVVSCEPRLEFFWFPLARLPRSQLEPRALRTQLSTWLRGRGPGWASTFTGDG